jgi:nucleoside-diphosphate-sugar epimerase
MDGELHVLFGAGQAGYRLAQRLLNVGKRVRVAKRTSGHVPPECEVVLGDARDPRFCVQASRGATTVYHCMNPPYDTRIWAETVPRYMDNLIAAAVETSARLVVLDNLYMLGRPNGRIRTAVRRCEDTGARTPRHEAPAREDGADRDAASACGEVSGIDHTETGSAGEVEPGLDVGIGGPCHSTHA